MRVRRRTRRRGKEEEENEKEEGEREEEGYEEIKLSPRGNHGYEVHAEWVASSFDRRLSSNSH